MSLQELLDSVGINKGDLAKLMSVNRKTVSRLGDNVTDSVMVAIDKYKADMTHGQSEQVPVPKNAVVVSDSDNHDNNVLPINHRNIALSRTWHHLDRKQVADRFDMSVFNYNQAVHDTISYCYDKDTNFIELRQ